MAFSYFAVLALQCMIAPFLAYQLNEAPTDMVIGESVYVLGSGSLIQLHRNLSLVKNMSLLEEFNDDALKLVLQEDDQQLLVCFGYGECFLFDTEDFYASEGEIPEFHSSEGIAISDSNGNSFYIASEEQGSVLDIQQYFVSYPDTCLVRSTQLRITNTSFTSRRFISAFRFDQYIYFVSLDTVFGSSTDTLNLMRLCSSESEELSCGPYTSDSNDVYEVTLSCGLLQGTLISGVFVYNATGTLVIGLSDSSYSRHCSLNLSVINAELDGTYDDCVAGNDKIPLPWAAYDQYTCSEFTEVSRCNFGSRNDGGDTIPALAARSPSVGDISMEVHNHSINISLPIVVDGTKIVYLAASNSTTNYFMKYFYDDSETMVLLEEYELRDPVVVMKQADDFLYLATTTEVIRYKITDCAQHTTCDSCTFSVDPLCGWCVLENKCTQHLECGSSELSGRWVQSQEQCIGNVTLNEDFITVDGVLKVAFDTIPSTSVFPSLSESESLVCLFTDIKNKATYNWTLVDNTCVDDHSTISLVNTSYITLSFKIVQDQQTFYDSKSVLTVFNCSQYARCISCQYAPPCGWCLYDNTCTGKRDQCRHASDWTSQVIDSQPAHTCPAVFKPDSGRYLQPVGVDKKLNLTTQFIPPPVDGFEYVCRVEYLGQHTAVFDVDALYVNDPDKQISCQFEKNQTIFSSQLPSGVNGARLSVLYIELNGESEQEIEFIRDNSSDSYQFDSVSGPPPPRPPPPEPSPDMLLYNCSQLSNSCSSCLSLRLRPEPFPCGWCRRTGLGYSDCTVSEDCHDTVDIFFNTDTSGRFCPLPLVSTVSPLSGPVQGGTVITITGTNLGVQATSVQSVMLGSYPCEVLENEYEPGQVIKCRATETTNTEDVDIVITIDRGGTQQATPVFTYSYLNPEITAVVPRYGPMSGGTIVTIEGSSLNVGNAEATVMRLAGRECAIMSINSSEIMCITSSHKVTNGLVQLSVDSAHVVEGTYSYLPDPVVLSALPTTTIESGGITLTFTGLSLNSTQEPRLVVYDEQGAHESICEAVGAVVLRCIAPRVQPLLNGINKRSRENVLQRTANYTLIMDNAPAPNISSPGLALVVKPDPVFTEIEESDRVYTRGSGEIIAILGRDMTNILPSEVTVTVDEFYCEDIVLSHNVLRCRPPLSVGDSDERTSAEVKVNVGGGTLEYSVGTLDYVPGSTSSLSTAELIAVVLGSSLALLIVLFSVCILALACLFVRKRRHVRRANQELVNGQNGKHEDEIANYSHENVYEDINDLVFSSNGKEWNVSIVKMMDENERYQGSLQRNIRTLPEIPSEEYIEMGAHSVRQTDDELLHTSIGRTHTTAMNGTVPPANGLTNGDYVDMLPSTDGNTCSSRDQSFGQSECILSATCDEDMKTRDHVLTSGTI